MFLGFQVLAVKKTRHFKRSPWALGKCDVHFSCFYDVSIIKTIIICSRSAHVLLAMQSGWISRGEIYLRYFCVFVSKCETFVSDMIARLHRIEFALIVATSPNPGGTFFVFFNLSNCVKPQDIQFTVTYEEDSKESDLRGWNRRVFGVSAWLNDSND